MEKTTLLLTESDRNQTDSCRRFLSKYGITVQSCANDGYAAYQKIRETAPTYVLLNLFMYGMDAISIKKKYDLENKNGRTTFFAAGSVQNDLLEKELINEGFRFYFLKPYDYKTLVDWVNRVSGQGSLQKGVGTTESAISSLLRKIGVPAHLLGYPYLKDAILMVLEDQTRIRSVTKDLYPSIARNRQTTDSRVERAIRHAIEVAWSRGDLQIQDEYFGNTVDAARGKPTNSEFIATIADYIQIGPRRQEFRQ